MSETEETQTSINDLEKWIESNGPKLFLFAQQQTGSHADAQDVYQDALVKVLKETMQSGGSQVPPVGRMFLAIKHRAIDLHRQRSSRTQRELRYGEIAPESDWFVPQLEEAEHHNQLQQAVRALPPEQQEVVILKIWGGQTFRSIAEILEVPVNTVASRFRYALSHIRSSLNLQAL